MKKIKRIPRRFHTSRRSYPFFISDGWISNGHFALADRCLDKDYFDSLNLLLCNDQQPDIGRVVPPLNDYKWGKNSGIILDKEDTRVLILFGEDCCVGINLDHFDFFGVESHKIMMFDDKNPVCFLNSEGKIDLVVMPFRIDIEYVEKLLNCKE